MVDEGNSRELTASEVRRVLLFGNGVNLVADCHSWLRSERVKNFFVDSSSGKQKLSSCFFEQCKKIRPTFVHHGLVALERHFSAFYTTNYDFAMERALCHETAHRKVLHIHGDALEKEQCIYAVEEYNEAAGHMHCIRSGGLETWHVTFLNAEVHVVGFNFAAEETLLYNLLRERRSRLLSREDFAWRGKDKRIYAWLMYEIDNPGDIEYRVSLLQGLSVTVIPIPVHQKNYAVAWECLLGKLLLHLHGIHSYRGQSCVLNLSCDDKHITTGMNVSYACEPDLKYPDCCLMWIGKKNFDAHASQRYWLFYCNMPEKTTLWRIDKSVLSPYLQVKEEARFYLDISRGLLYAGVEFQASPIPIAHCLRIDDMTSFDDFIGQ